ncbi:hypothetical protein CSUI_002969 [Cystoisospora suis]|uniref:Transmembrane protein n=1 Tax=Cystoisospora suis TaxID=483139 RepID=A0A2C6KGL9_9APIC|nr:hypothetical protein CSUI_002969 [Cystoisospora suis]
MHAVSHDGCRVPLHADTTVPYFPPFHLSGPFVFLSLSPSMVLHHVFFCRVLHHDRRYHPLRLKLALSEMSLMIFLSSLLASRSHSRPAPPLRLPDASHHSAGTPQTTVVLSSISLFLRRKEKKQRTGNKPHSMQLGKTQR